MLADQGRPRSASVRLSSKIRGGVLTLGVERRGWVLFRVKITSAGGSFSALIEPDSEALAHPEVRIPPDAVEAMITEAHATARRG